MNHVAIDLGGKESQICIRHSDGTIIEERKIPTRNCRR
jgi:predicted NBD/HSP70 family sugar kinase